MSAKLIEEGQLAILRDSGLITENEIALIEGDILLAKNVITQERRIIGKSDDVLNEGNNRRVLKG